MVAEVQRAANDEDAELWDPAVRRVRQAAWDGVLTNIKQDLKGEIAAHGDVVEVPGLLDVYRTLPHKLLAACRLAAAVFRPTAYLVKVDDDVYLELSSMSASLDAVEHEAAWWGQFRRDWPVARQGKWAEFEYPGKRYPDFACGGAYALPAHLFEWVGDNAASLHAYQGEDVSLGIWLAAVGPRQRDDRRWRCFKGCDRDMIASPEHSPGELRALWARRMRCNNPCACAG